MTLETVFERVEKARRAGLSGRLMKGALALGELRRMGLFCSGEWSGTCPCNPRSDFCDAKMRWLGLAEDLYGGPPWGLTGFEKFYLVEAMTTRQFDATRLNLRIMPPTGHDSILVGPRGTDWATIKTLSDLYGSQDYPEALAAVVTIQKVLR